MVLYRLRCDVLEKDTADRFGISSSTVSRTWITWINFLYHTLNQLPIWPSSKVVKETMPACFLKIIIRIPECGGINVLSRVATEFPLTYGGL